MVVQAQLMSVPVRRWYCQKEPVAMRVCSAVYNESRQTRREHYRGGRRLRTGKNKTNARCQGRRVALTVAENGLMNWTHELDSFSEQEESSQLQRAILE